MYNPGVTKSLLNRLPCFTADPIKFQEPNRAEYTERIAPKPLLIRCEVPYDMNSGVSSLIVQQTWIPANPFGQSWGSAFVPWKGHDSYPTVSYVGKNSVYNTY